MEEWLELGCVAAAFRMSSGGLLEACSGGTTEPSSRGCLRLGSRGCANGALELTWSGKSGGVRDIEPERSEGGTPASPCPG